MALTQEELSQIKGVVKEENSQTERIVTTALTNLERELKVQRSIDRTLIETGLKREIQTSEDNIRQEIHTVKEEVHTIKQVLHAMEERIEKRIQLTESNIIQTQGEVHEDHELRIQKLEKIAHI